MATLAAPLLDRLPVLTEQLVNLICAEEEVYREADSRVIEDVRRSCHENLSGVVRDLAGLGPLRVGAPRETARRRAEQGVPLASVLHAYRLGLRVIWEALLDEMSDHPQELRHVVTRMWTILDTASQAVAGAYEETLVDLARRDERRRTLLLDNLLEGHQLLGDLQAKLAPALGLPDKGMFVAVSAEVPAAGSEGLPRADQVLRLQGIRSVWRLRADEQVGVVALDRPAGVVQELLGSVAVTRAGISPPYADLRETARGLALAALARRCVGPGRTGVEALDAHPLGVLVAGAPETAECVARGILGPVLELDPDERDVLLATLDAWVGGGGSASAAARLLSCHRNTVRNRLLRLEELTGRSVAHPRSLIELCTGAEAVRLLDLG